MTENGSWEAFLELQTSENSKIHIEESENKFKFGGKLGGRATVLKYIKV